MTDQLGPEPEGPRTQIKIRVTDEMLAEIDKRAERMGLPRNATVVALVDQALAMDPADRRIFTLNEEQWQRFTELLDAERQLHGPAIDMGYLSLPQAFHDEVARQQAQRMVDEHVRSDQAGEAPPPTTATRPGNKRARSRTGPAEPGPAATASGRKPPRKAVEAAQPKVRDIQDAVRDLGGRKPERHFHRYTEDIGPHYWDQGREHSTFRCSCGDTRKDKIKK